MKDLIQDYEALYRQIVRQIYNLKKQLQNENLRTIEHDQLKARHDLLVAERFEIVDAINEMRKHL